MKHSPLVRSFLSFGKRKMHHARQHGKFHDFFKHHSMEERRFSAGEDHHEHHFEQHRIGHDHHGKHEMGHHQHGMMHKLGHHHGMKHKLGHHHGMKHKLGHHHGMKHKFGHHYGMKHKFGHHQGMMHEHRFGHHGVTDDHHERRHGKHMMKKCHGMKHKMGHGVMHKRHGPGMHHRRRFFDSGSDSEESSDCSSETEEISTSASKTKAKVTRENDKFQIDLDTSYYQPEKVTVEIMDGKINISATHESMEDDSYEFHEMYRSFSIPADVNPINITSQLNTDGKLIVEAPITAAEGNATNQGEILVTQASE